ncbi:MAG: bifunctional adenosylcobinamide kinase/adenosylcobinamide-phosphate guanylyltransferase [Eubacteriales bacterium]|nr:bifunctional adenosylcobinamide kinase/adenosylcobinamide-phosphate guanylyltransferase [Eubacteriales bacterium]
MIIVYGGKYQGTESFAKELADKRAGSVLVLRFMEKCREELAAGKDPYEELMALMTPAGLKTSESDAASGMETENKITGQLIIEAREIGNGIVPLDKEDRIFREEYGRLLLRLAKEADEIYRVICGIAQRIK